jgi:hypothetical protein
MEKERERFSRQDLERAIGSRQTMDAHFDPIIIYNKEITETLAFNTRIHLNNGVSLKPLIFSDCIFNEDVTIGNYENAGKIILENCIFNKTVSIVLNNTKFDNQCVFNDNLKIDATKISDLTLEGINVNCTLQILNASNNVILKNINQGKKTSKQIIKLMQDVLNLELNNVYAENLIFSDFSTISRNFEIQNIEVNQLTIGNIELNTSLNVKHSKINKIVIGNISGRKRDVHFSECELSQFTLEIHKLSKLSVTGGTINNLELTESNIKDSLISIEKSTIINLKFNKLYNNGIISLKELTIPSRGLLSFKSSTLGKTDFINCNFSNAVLEFQNNKITEAFFSETEFPKKVTVDGKANYGQAQLAFGQLATAFQKQGDSIRALEYISRELEAHYYHSKWRTSFFTKLNLFLNGISNSFGRNWIKGVGFSFGIGFLFFCLLLISTDKYHWGFPVFDFNMTPAYLRFMNPLRFFELQDLFKNTEKQDAIKLNELSFIADFGGRIFVAYGYYQTIQAFRRFGRK